MDQAVTDRADPHVLAGSTPRLRPALERLWEASDATPMLQFEGRWVPWGEVRTLAEQIDARLTAAGAGPGSRVGVVLGNRPASVAAVLALLGRERCLVTLSPLQPGPRLARDVEAAELAMLFGPLDLLELPEVRTSLEGRQPSTWVLEDGSVERHTGPDQVRDDLAPGIAVEMLTSGTTGLPKRIALSYAQLEASLQSALQHTRGAVDERAPLTGRVSLVALPVVHIGGLWGLLQGLVEARPIALLPRFSVEAWVAAVREHRPKVAGLPPAAIRAVLDAEVPVEDLASLRALNSGTARLDPDVADAFHERYGVPVLSVYGATEFSGAVAGWSLRDHATHWAAKRGSVGRPFPGVQLRVVDEDGRQLGAGQAGRLEVCTRQAGNGGWLRTTDLARLDDDGFLFILGRADDVIVRGGFKVSPGTVAAALQRHPSVVEAAVAPLPDLRLGEVPVAAVELDPSAPPVTGEELRALCRTVLTPYEVPVEVFVLDALPRSASLKVDRTALLAQLQDLLQAREAEPVAAGPAA
ncbi:MAG: AMP-dependent synthetase and ligase [Frankiales bacterium]|nr:AMP-dependent synthetase and ligase [Frankiales bacterium]